MKTIKVIMLTLLVAFLIAIAYSSSRAAEDGTKLRLYTSVGGMNVNEASVSEGHKSLHSAGIEYIIYDVYYKFSFGIDGFIRGEAEDEDPEIPCSGGGAFITHLFKIDDIFQPYLGIRYDHISRGTAPKYDDPDDLEYASYGPNPQIESEHDIVSARGGIHIPLGKYMYTDFGVIIPFYTSTKSGNFAPEVAIGFLFGNWDLSYKYRQYRMTNNHFSGPTALSFTFSGVELGYSF
jgi:hypothetical protein